MASNTGTSTRKGAVKGRTQVYNPATGNFIKRDTETGKFIGVKSDGKPFKGIRTEKSNLKSNPNIKKSIAKKAEKAVIAAKNAKPR